MGKHNKFEERGGKPIQRELKNLETRSGKREPYIVLSFKDFDRNQGQSFEEWQESGFVGIGDRKAQGSLQPHSNGGHFKPNHQRVQKRGFPSRI